MAMDFREPMPERPPRDYTGKVVHVITCEWCGHREGFTVPASLASTHALTGARKRGWLTLPILPGSTSARFVCSAVCAAHHPHHGRPIEEAAA